MVIQLQEYACLWTVQACQHIAFQRAREDFEGFQQIHTFICAKFDLLQVYLLFFFQQSEGANITANSVHPGAVATNILRRPGFFLGMSSSPQVLELITSRSTHKILIFRYIVFGVYADVVRVLGKYVVQYIVKTPRQVNFYQFRNK